MADKSNADCKHDAEQAPFASSWAGVAERYGEGADASAAFDDAAESELEPNINAKILRKALLIGLK